jgi:hypothetical protein
VSTRAVRTLRGAAFAVVATLLAALAHTLGGGGAPSPLFCAAVAALALPPSVALAGARMSRWRTAAAVGASQALFHIAFAVTGDIGPADALAAGHDHLHAAAAVSSMPSALASGDAAMLPAHLVAAVVTFAAVRRGETVLAGVLRWTRTVLRRVVVVLAQAPTRPRPAVRVPFEPRPPRVSAAPLTRRGPPAFLAA